MKQTLSSLLTKNTRTKSDDLLRIPLRDIDKPQSAVSRKASATGSTIIQPSKLSFLEANQMQQVHISQKNSLFLSRPASANVTRLQSPHNSELPKRPIGSEMRNYDTRDEPSHNIQFSINEGPPDRDVQKFLPIRVKYDKEQMYGEILTLRQKFNEIKEENMKLKTQCSHFERENKRLMSTVEKIIESNPNVVKVNDNTLAITLKQKIRDLKEVLKAKMEEVETMKRSIKVTRMQEVEIELKEFQDENIRLKAFVTEFTKNNSSKRYQALDQGPPEKKDEIIAQLRRDNERLAAEIKFLEDQNCNILAERDVETKNAKKNTSELNKVKRKLKEKEREMQKTNLEAQFENPHSLDPVINKIKAEFQDKMIKSEQVFLQQEKNFNEALQKAVERANAEAREKQNMLRELAKVKESYTELETKYKMILNNYESEKKRTTEKAYYMRFEEDLPTELRDLNSKETKVNEFKLKKVRRVTHEDVKGIGQELTLWLRLKMISYEEAERKLFDKFASRGHITVLEAKNMFLAEPFNIREEATSLLVARYLVEPNEEETTLLDFNRSCSLSIAKSVFKKLVGSYQLLDRETDARLYEQIGRIFQKYDEHIYSYFKETQEPKNGMVDIKVIFDALKNFGAQLTPEQIDYLTFKAFELNQNLKSVEYRRLFDLFDTEEHKRLKQIYWTYQKGQDLHPRELEKIKQVKEEDEESQNDPDRASQNEDLENEDDNEELQNVTGYGDDNEDAEEMDDREDLRSDIDPEESIARGR